jgi:glucokinase
MVKGRGRLAAGESGMGAKKKGGAGALFAGIDIGGTKLHVVVARANGKIVGRARKKLKGETRFAPVMKRVVECLEEACEAAGIEVKGLRAVGVGAPSAVRADGTAVHAPNMGWRNVPLAAKLRQLLPVRVVAGNDCDVGTLGEYTYGAGRGSKSLVGLFVGTGLGGGIVHRGELISGESHLAAEVGHMTVVVGGRECACGHRGCLEAYAAKSGMGRRLRQEAAKGRRSRKLVEAGAELANVRSSVLSRAYRARDTLVREVVDEAAEYLGVGVANLITLLGPDTVVLGGGVIEALGREMLPQVRKAVQAHVFPPTSFKDTRIVAAALGDDAVALGAVAYARLRLG